MKKFVYIGLVLMIVFYIIFLITNNIFIEGALYGSVISYINCIGIKMITNMFLTKKKGKFFVLLSTLLKISLIALITVFLVEYLSLDLIGFLSGFSVVLIVFILLIQDK